MDVIAEFILICNNITTLMCDFHDILQPHIGGGGGGFSPVLAIRDFAVTLVKVRSRELSSSFVYRAVYRVTV